MIGIYKITNPIGEVYIGQSTNIEKRLKTYTYNKGANTQTKLKMSFLEYGVNNHKFEIIKECKIEKLNEYERFYQEFYNCVEKGLNCRFTSDNNKSGYLSEETKAKMRLNRVGTKGMKFSKETRYKMSLRKPTNKGSRITEETKAKLMKKIYKPIINIENGIFYDSIKDACKTYNIPYSTLCSKLRGDMINDSPFGYI